MSKTCTRPEDLSRDALANGRRTVASVGTGNSGAPSVPRTSLLIPLAFAAAVAFLASDEVRFITGVVLPVDGGATAYSRMLDLSSPEWAEAIANHSAAT